MYVIELPREELVFSGTAVLTPSAADPLIVSIACAPLTGAMPAAIP